MFDLETKLAKAAWELGPISKVSIPTDILHELVNDFIIRQEVKLVAVEELKELNTYTVVISGDETIELYSDWMQTFEEHGYEAPFLVVDNTSPDL